MNTIDKQILPRLFCGDTKEDREVINLLEGAKIPYKNLGYMPEEKLPLLKYKIWKFSGVSHIKEFIDRWQNNKLSELI